MQGKGPHKIGCRKNRADLSRIFVALVIAVLTFFCLGTSSARAQVRTVTVGVYENAPKVFTAESGKPVGIFIDLIEEIAKIEGWELRYVSGTWGEGLDRLAKGEIDLMPDVAYTAEREKVYSFPKVPVLSSWYQIYAPKGSDIHSILDLKEKRVVVLERSVQQDSFARLNKGFGLNTVLISVPDYQAMFELVAKGNADAAITNRFYGMMHAKKYGLEDTTIIFEPSDLFFAAPKGDPKKILTSIDDRLAEFKKNAQSVYYRSLKHWTSEEVKFKLPAWLQVLGLVLGVALFMSLVGSFVLRRQVNARTRELEIANNELRSSEQRYRFLFERNPAPMLIYERETLRLLAVNDAFAEHYGYSVEQALAMFLTDFYPEEEKSRIIELIPRLKGLAYVGEWHHLKADGSIMTIVVQSHDLDYLGYDARIAVISDISERKRIEDALRNSEEKFFKAFHATPDAIVLSRAADGLLLEFNEVFLVQTGYSREEAMTRTTLELQLWADPHDREQYGAAIREHGRVRDMEARFRTKSGSLLDGLVSGERILLNDELCLLTIIRDITERKKTEGELEKHRIHLEEMVGERTAELEESQQSLKKLLADVIQAKAELEAANKRLKELDQLKSMFIASMSHELRTPLNSIIGFTGITLQGLSGEINEEQRDNLSRAYHSGKHLLSLITDVIDISKIEAGRVDAFPEVVSLKKIIDEAIDTIAPQLKEKNLVLKVEIDSDIELHTDHKRLLQCLINLLSNAMKFTEQGGITVAVSEQDAMVDIAVSDTGIGIAERDLPKLFEAFERLETHLQVKAGGTGLGLYLTKKLATDILHGSISVRSKEGEGSTFSLHIPKTITPADSLMAGGGGVQ